MEVFPLILQLEQDIFRVNFYFHFTRIFNDDEIGFFILRPASPEMDEAPASPGMDEAPASPEMDEATARRTRNDELEMEIMNNLYGNNFGHGNNEIDVEERRFERLTRVAEMLKKKEEEVWPPAKDASTMVLTALIKNINAAAINILPIKLSAKSKELDKATFLLWVEEFNNGCDMQSITDEHEKFSYFKGKIGAHGTSLWKSIALEAPQDLMEVRPYTTAIAHLKAWFNRRFGDALARQEIRNMHRDGIESAVAYANRVYMAIQALGISPAESFSLFIDTISIGVNSEVLGSKIIELVTEGPDIYAVIKKIQAFEMSGIFKANFKANAKKAETSNERVGDVFALSNTVTEGRFKRSAPPGRSSAPNWKRQRFQRSDQSSVKGPSCERCLDREHKEEDCFHKNSRCYECGVIGHIGRACRQKKLQHQLRQTPRARNVAAIVKKLDSDMGEDVSGR